jgi:hypothetical protein
MDTVLKELRGMECWVFLDDLIVFSDTIEEHANRLEHVLQRFEKANLLLQPAKCVFAKSKFSIWAMWCLQRVFLFHLIR